ncbi:LysE family translocator [Glutamicibacter arilaitensis]|uniref:LysE family translocator n=1 Tax=Glutamicibacter arilaitensis TaxID=256701 RepID=UPI00384D7603
MGLESWAAFALALLVALAVPGPDLALVVQSATRSVQQGVSTAAGVVTGLMLHALLALAGVTALLISAPGAMTIAQILGAMVLLWLGISMLRAGLPEAATTEQDHAPRTSGGYVRGLVTNATNPKALLFFSAILPQFIGQAEGAGLRTALLCATVVLGAGLWWAGAIAVVRFSGVHRSPAAERIVTLAGGVSLVAIAVVLLAAAILGLVHAAA